jgi:hypothetical protein
MPDYGHEIEFGIEDVAPQVRERVTTARAHAYSGSTPRLFEVGE